MVTYSFVCYLHLHAVSDHIINVVINILNVGSTAVTLSVTNMIMTKHNHPLLSCK